MSHFRRSNFSFFTILFLISLGLTISLYVIRGLKNLTFLPGGILTVLIVLTIVSGLIVGIGKTKRF